MLQLFRNFFKSKVGVLFTLAFLALIALAFASSDIATTGTFGGVSGGDRVAVVGDRKLGAAELRTSMTNALDQARQSDPRVTMQSFIASGAIDSVMRQMLERTALAEFGKLHGLRAGDRLVDSEILQIPAFRGVDGKFDEEAFKATLQQRGLSEATVREDLAMGLFARQLAMPVMLEARVPRSLALSYATLLREQRKGAIATLPSAAFAPKGDPSEAQIKAFYDATRDNYIRPERRVVRYATFGDEALGQLRAPTAAEIRARYDRDRALYAAKETRSFTQLVVPTQAAAQAIVAELQGGRSLADSAREKGLAASAVGPVTREELALSTSAAVARAAFAAGSGELVAPARGGLGWYVLRVDEIDRTPARSVEQASTEISQTLAAEQRQAALSDLTARIEDEFDGGRSLSEVAQELKVEVQLTAPATADGQIYGKPGESVAPELAPILKVAFEMDEGEPQLAEAVPGTTYIVFDVSEITPSRVAPLTEIRGEVAELWRRDEGAKAARAAADRVMSRIAKGQSIQQSLAAEAVSLPPADAVDLTRDEISQQGRVPPVLALLFSMAEGTVKRLEAPDDAGWFVVQLDDIEPGKVSEDDPIIAATMAQLGEASGAEYMEQFLAAVQREVKVERNQVAIDAVSAQLTGAANQ